MAVKSSPTLQGKAYVQARNAERARASLKPRVVSSSTKSRNLQNEAKALVASGQASSYEEAVRMQGRPTSVANSQKKPVQGGYGTSTASSNVAGGSKDKSSVSIDPTVSAQGQTSGTQWGPKSQSNIAQGYHRNFNNQIVKDAPQDYVPTQEERVQAELAGQQTERYELGEELLGDLNPEVSSMEEYVNEFKASQEKQRDLANRVREQANASAIAQGTDVATQGFAAISAVNAAMAQGREGPMSATGQSVADMFKSRTMANINQYANDTNVAVAQRNDAYQGLLEAQRQGRSDLVTQYQNLYNQADSKIQEADTQYLNALANAQSVDLEVQAANRANLSAFTGLVDSGTEMDINSISQFANNLNIPFDTAYSYYTGSQAIRDDKSMDAATKDLALQQSTYEFNQQIKGLATKEAQAVDNYLTLVQSGSYTPDQLKSFAIAMNIPDEKNPVYQNELKLQAAELKIKENEANGVISNPLDLIDLAQKTYDYYQSIGYDPATLPEGGGSIETTAIPTENGIQFGFEDGTKISSGTRALSQCGQFVNDITGFKMGDSYASKMGYVDASIKVPAAGMVFVMPVTGDYAPNGHTGMVEYFNPQTSMVGVADVNSDGKGTAKHHEIPLSTILNGGGFAQAPKSVALDGAADVDQYSYSAYYNQAVNSGMDKNAAKKYAEKKYDDAQAFSTVDQSNSYNAYSKMLFETSNYENTVQGFNDDQLEEYSDAAGAINRKISDPDSLLTSQLINQYIDDPKVRQLILSESRWIGAKLRKESGAAITAGEYLTEGSQFWPRKGDDAEDIKIKEQARKNIESNYYNIMGAYGQKLVGSEPTTVADQTSEWDDIDVLSGEDLLSNW
jgi:hypothetical protein